MYESFREGACVGISLNTNPPPNIQQLEGDGIVTFSQEKGHRIATLNGAFECIRNDILIITEAIQFRVADTTPSEKSLSSLIMCSDIQLLQPRGWEDFAKQLHLVSHFEIGLTEDEVRRYLRIVNQGSLGSEDIVFLEHIQERAKLHLHELQERVRQKKNTLLGINGTTTLF